MAWRSGRSRATSSCVHSITVASSRSARRSLTATLSLSDPEEAGMTRGASALLQDSQEWLVYLDAQQEPSSNTCWDQGRLRQHSKSKALAEEQSHCQAS